MFFDVLLVFWDRGSPRSPGLPPASTGLAWHFLWTKHTARWWHVRVQQLLLPQLWGTATSYSWWLLSTHSRVCQQWITVCSSPPPPPPHRGKRSRKWVNTRQCTNSGVTLLKDLVGQQFQRAAVHSRSRGQVPLDCMVSLPTVGGAWVEYYLPLYGSGFWVPKTWADEELNSTNLIIHSSTVWKSHWGDGNHIRNGTYWRTKSPNASECLGDLKVLKMSLNWSHRYAYIIPTTLKIRPQSRSPQAFNFSISDYGNSVSASATWTDWRGDVLPPHANTKLGKILQQLFGTEKTGSED